MDLKNLPRYGTVIGPFHGMGTGDIGTLEEVNLGEYEKIMIIQGE